MGQCVTRSNQLVPRALEWYGRCASRYAHGASCADHQESGLPGSRAIALVIGGAPLTRSHLVECLLALGRRVARGDLANGTVVNIALAYTCQPRRNGDV